jgi:hypothetical protein
MILVNFIINCKCLCLQYSIFVLYVYFQSGLLCEMRTEGGEVAVEVQKKRGRAFRHFPWSIQPPSIDSIERGDGLKNSQWDRDKKQTIGC